MANLNDERCPYCFSKFSENKWIDDPLLVKNGSKLVYDEETKLLVPENDISKRRHKGCTIIKNQHIKELQEANDDNKPTNGWTIVQGDVEGYWIPNKIHIKEIRDAIEKGLGIKDSTTSVERTEIMELYLNYDEDGNERQLPHQLDWNDSTLTDAIWRGNISHMHIEDLRKQLVGDEVITGYGSYSVPYVYSITHNNFWKLRESTSPLIIVSKNNYSPTVYPSHYTSSIALTKDSIIAEYPIPGVGTGEPPPVRTQDWIYKIDRRTWEKTNIVNLRPIAPAYFTTNFPLHIAIFADNSYIYAITCGEPNEYFVKLDYDGNVIFKKFYGFYPIWSDGLGFLSSFRTQAIGMNKDFIYVLYTVDHAEAFPQPPPAGDLYKSHLRVMWFSKITFEYIAKVTIKVYDGYIYPSPGGGMYSLKADNEYVYVMNAEPINVQTGIYQPRLSVYRVNDMSLVLTKDIGTQNYNPGYIGQTEKILSLRGKCYTKPIAPSYTVDLLGDMPIPIYDNGITPVPPPGYTAGTPSAFYGDWERKMQSL
jgi:hypothetical protein